MDWRGWLTQPEARILLRGNGIVGGTNLHGINRQYPVPKDEEGCEPCPQHAQTAFFVQKAGMRASAQKSISNTGLWIGKRLSASRL
jgi:hypothetical protein